MSSFVYEGRVRACPRPKVARATGAAYMPKWYRPYLEKLGWAYRAAGGIHYGDRPVRVTVDVMRALPASRPKRVESEPDDVKPDLDNVVKAVLDALNGVAYDDDAQVVSICAMKCDRTRLPERMRVSVRPADGED